MQVPPVHTPTSSGPELIANPQLPGKVDVVTAELLNSQSSYSACRTRGFTWQPTEADFFLPRNQRNHGLLMCLPRLDRDNSKRYEETAGLASTNEMQNSIADNDNWAGIDHVFGLLGSCALSWE